MADLVGHYPDETVDEIRAELAQVRAERDDLAQRIGADRRERLRAEKAGRAWEETENQLGELLAAVEEHRIGDDCLAPDRDHLYAVAQRIRGERNG